MEKKLIGFGESDLIGPLADGKLIGSGNQLYIP